MDNTVNFQINIAGNVFVGTGKLQRDLEKLKLSVNTLDGSINKTFGKLKETVNNINLTSIITQFKEVAEGIANISAPGIMFEQSMADLSSITGIAGRDLQELGKVARQTGRESGLGAAEAAKAFSILASQIEVDDIGMDGLKELQQNAITLSHAAGISMDEAANALAGTINQYGLNAGEAARVINVLAAGSKYGAAEINDLAQSFKVVGAQASIAGLSVEDTAGAIEILSKNNVKGAEAGTNLRNIILAMQTTLGIDFSKTSLTDALDALKPKLNDAAFMSQTFGRMSMASAQFLVQNAEAVADMTDKVTGTNTAIEQAATRTETVGQMIARTQAWVDNLKIGFFNLTGSVGGVIAAFADQGVLIAQLLPLFGAVRKMIKWVTDAEKLQAFWAGIVKGATMLWTGVQWALNASLWGCPIVWIVAGIAALIAIIVVCVTKVQGWGAQWDSIVKFMKLTFQLYVKTIKFEFQTLVNGIMIGLDYIKLGWYKFKQAVGIGDSSENEAMIAKVGADIDRRKTAIVDGAKELADLAKQASGALTWELSWKGKEQGDSAKTGIIPMPGAKTGGAAGAATSGLGLNLGGKTGTGGTGSGTGGSSTLDLNRIVPDLKGTTSYSAIASRLGSFRTSAITAAASVALPLTVAATTLPKTGDPLLDRNRTEYMAGNGRRSVNATKFCDSVVIHIANADGKGYEQTRSEVTQVLKEVLDDHGA